MSDKTDLHTRLDALSEKIESARKTLDFKGKLKDGHHLTTGEMEARYAFLKSEVDGEMADLESHGHHVSALEQDVMTWLAGVDLDT
ncbi:3-ketoacyl-ACP reductase [Halovulum sp. GXIMD14793]